ncbi:MULTISPECIES: phytanoyl-CoA dioxygenase family protein [Streptomyces]|uniref:phytanoyl-CoA dioxygenase family protein n=1 Tax=Streptomyces TaxID=1883 RepID=UPI0004BD0910|nr:MULTISPECIES: phytanoyl-CoA dioxygenase family protein [Streptomyces]
MTDPDSTDWRKEAIPGLSVVHAGTEREAAARQFADQGIVRLTDIFDETGLRRIQEEVAEHIRTEVPRLDRDVYRDPDGTTVRVVNNLQRYRPYFARLLSDDALLDLVESITGWTPLPFYAEYFAKVPGGAVANPHQERAFEYVDPPQYIHLWIALEDITPDQGPLRFWLGSHKQGVLPHTERDFSGMQYIPDDVLEQHGFPVRAGVGSAGDTFVLDSGTIHASSLNTGSRPRPSLVLAYRGAGTELRTA